MSESTQQNAQSASGDFARAAVTGDATTSGLSLAMIITGGTIGFAIFVASSEIGGSLGYHKAALAFIIGSLVLGIMGAMTSYVGYRSRLSTYILTEFAFGSAGAKLANLVVAISLIGWYGVISNFLGQSAHGMFLAEPFGIDIPVQILVVFASILMIGVTLMGFTGIDRFNLILVPLMLAFIAYAAYRAYSMWEGGTPASLDKYTFQTAASAVVGSYIAGVIIQPDYSRFAKSGRGAIWGAFIALAVIFPAIQFLSAIPSMTTGIADFIKVMGVIGLAVSSFFLIAIGAWASNILCLYSSGLSIATLSKKASLKMIIAIIGVIGTSIALVPAQGYLASFLITLGVLIPPIGAIYLIDGFVVRKFDYNIDQLAQQPKINIGAIVSWIAGTGFGLGAGSLGLYITKVPSIDTIIVTSAVFMAFIYWAKKKARTVS